MRFLYTCILSFFFLITTAAAIPTPREGHPTSSLTSLGRPDSYDDVLELNARSKETKGAGTHYNHLRQSLEVETIAHARAPNSGKVQQHFQDTKGVGSSNLGLQRSRSRFRS